MKDAFSKPTALLDYTHADLAKKREHLLTNVKRPADKVRSLYAFVSSLPLCYSRNDDQAASVTLSEGCGQCNTKTILMAALCRGAGIPTRLHAYHLTKEAQVGRIPNWLLFFAPKLTLFFWPEFKIGVQWRPLQALVQIEECEYSACPFDGARCQSQPLRPEWIVKDLGAFASPDEYFAKHDPTVHGWRKIGWALLGRRALNSRLKKNI